jgi:hypothetical protein
MSMTPLIVSSFKLIQGQRLRRKSTMLDLYMCVCVCVCVCVCEWVSVGYLFAVIIYKFEITATILITNILVIWRVQFKEIRCQGVRKWKKVWEPLI